MFLARGAMMAAGAGASLVRGGGPVAARLVGSGGRAGARLLGGAGKRLVTSGAKKKKRGSWHFGASPPDDDHTHHITITHARIGPWRDDCGLEKEHWADEGLSGQLEQLELFARGVADSVRLRGELGSGADATVFLCTLRRVGDVALKLPKPLLDAEYLRFSPNGFLIVDRRKRPSDAVLETALMALTREFEWFESIYEPAAFFRRFHGGQRGHDIGADELRVMRAELASLERHPGRAHIHEFLHFDAGIPAILSEPCDGDLRGLREAHAELFAFDAPAWRQVAVELASAMHYMRTMGAVHVDLKLDNVLYVGHSSAFTCKITDFGHCFADALTTEGVGGAGYYCPMSWPHAPDAVVHPLALSVYNYAALLSELLYLREVRWPVHDFCFEAALSSLRRSSREVAGEFFPTYVDADYERAHPAWFRMALVLTLDYRTEACFPQFEHVEAFVSALSPVSHKKSRLI
jgi:hypothetical protein